MNSGHSDSDQSPRIHRINIMPNPETKQADDERGDYTNANSGEGADGGADQQEEQEKVTEKVADKGTVKDADKGTDKIKDRGGAGQADHDAKKDTVVIVDPSSLDSGKGDCCTRFKKFCVENKCLVGWVCILIILVLLFFGLYVNSRSSAAGKEVMPPPSTVSPGVSTASSPGPTGVSSKTTSSPDPSGVSSKTTSSPDPSEPPVAMAIIQGTVTTANNYTAALADPTSLAFKAFDNSFSAAVVSFYAEKQKAYIGYYFDTIVSSIEPAGRQTVVQFEIQFSQLDNDDQIPDAHTVLSDQLNQGQLGPFLIVDVGSLVIS